MGIRLVNHEFLRGLFLINELIIDFCGRVSISKPIKHMEIKICISNFVVVWGPVPDDVYFHAGAHQSQHLNMIPLIWWDDMGVNITIVTQQLMFLGNCFVSALSTLAPLDAPDAKLSTSNSENSGALAFLFARALPATTWAGSYGRSSGFDGADVHSWSRIWRPAVWRNRKCNWFS